MKHIIHQSPEERLAAGSEAHLQALGQNIHEVKGVRSAIDTLHTGTQHTNQLLEQMAPSVQRGGSAADFIDGFIRSIKGDPGKDGETPSPEQLVQLIKPLIPAFIPAPIPGKDGRNGRDGRDSTTPGPQGDTVAGPAGTNGVDGKDGSPDTPEGVVEKVNKSTTKIEFSQVKGLSEIARTVDQIGKNPQGQNVGGANPIIIKNAGTRVSDYVTEINFSTNLTATYANNGLVTVTATGGSGGFTKLTTASTINGVNQTFVFSQAPTYIVSDGVWYDSNDWTGTTTITLTIPGPQARIWGFA